MHLCHRQRRRRDRRQQLARADELRRQRLWLPRLFLRRDGQRAPPSISRSATSASGPASIFRGASTSGTARLASSSSRSSSTSSRPTGTRPDRPSYVSDEHGVVLITSVPSWRFMTTAPLADPMAGRHPRAACSSATRRCGRCRSRRPEASSPTARSVHAIARRQRCRDICAFDVRSRSTPAGSCDYLVPAEAPIAAARARSAAAGAARPGAAAGAGRLSSCGAGSRRRCGIAAEQAARERARAPRRRAHA